MSVPRAPRDFSDSGWQQLHGKDLLEFGDAYKAGELRRPPTEFAALDSRWADEFQPEGD